MRVVRSAGDHPGFAASLDVLERLTLVLAGDRVTTPAGRRGVISTIQQGPYGQASTPAGLCASLMWEDGQAESRPLLEVLDMLQNRISLYAPPGFKVE